MTFRPFWTRAAVAMTIAVALVLTATAGIATAQTSEPDPDAGASAEHEPLFSRRPTFRSTEWFPDTAVPGSGQTVDVNVELLANATLKLLLPNGPAVTAERSQLLSDSSDSAVWVGQVPGTPGSQVVFAVRDGVAAGQVQLNDRIWELTAVRQGGYALFEVDETALPPLDYPVGKEPPARFGDGDGDGQEPFDELPSFASTRQQSAALTQIDLLVLHTPATYSNYSRRGLHASIDLSIARTNLAFADSGVHARVNIVHVAEVDYVESGSSRSYDDLSLASGGLSVAPSLRNRYQADLVMLVTDDNDVCGLARVPYNGLNEQISHSIINVRCLSGLTVAHEIGHNLGSNHAKDQPGSGIYSYSHGYRVCGEFHTIMAYPCGSFPVPQFSSPDLQWYARQLGVDPEIDFVNGTHAVRTFNLTAPEVAKYRTATVPSSPPTAPSAPAAASSNLGAPGTGPGSAIARISWFDNASDEAGFRIEWSTDAENWTTVGTVGANVSSFSDGPLTAGSTHFYRVTAFNGAGNSPRSAVVTVTTPLPSIDSSSVSASWACGSTIEDSLGLVAVDISNTGSSSAQMTVSVGTVERVRTVAAGDSDTVRVSGRRDGRHTVTVRSGSTVVHREPLIVNCTTDYETYSLSSCVNGNGRVTVLRTNITDSDVAFHVGIGKVPARVRVLAPQETGRFVVTGRPDGVLPVLWSTDGSVPEISQVSVLCDPTVTVSCLAGNGRIDVRLRNFADGSNAFAVTIGNLAARERTIPKGEEVTVTATGRADGRVAVRVTQGGVPSYVGSVRVACDGGPPPGEFSVDVTSRCLSGNGRIDVVVGNNGPSLPVLVTFNGGIDRNVIVAPGSVRRITVTGRPDGDWVVRVSSNGALLLPPRTVQINC